MYGELTALSNQSGFCWASNQYFSDLYETSERSIQRWIKALEQKKYIKVEVKGVSRKIWIMEFVETDEDGNPMERRKKTRLPRESKNKIAIRLQHKFVEMCKKFVGIEPVMDKVGYIRICFALGDGKLTEVQIVDLFDEWFHLGKPDDQVVSLPRALSNRQIEANKVRNNITS